MDLMGEFTRGSADFLNAELKMLQGLFSGDGIDHHMEPTCEWCCGLLMEESVYFVQKFISLRVLNVLLCIAVPLVAILTG